MSERITWTTCPHCGELAAVGWLQETAVEFDCTRSCSPSDQPLTWEVRAYRLAMRRPPPLDDRACGPGANDAGDGADH